MNKGEAVKGDFRVIRMDGLFHVVFRPDDDPEWFRIIATFFTYERAWCYCDIERVSSYEIWDGEYDNSETMAEERQGLRTPPVDGVPQGWMAAEDGAVDLVRNICTDADAAVAPHPKEDFSDHPQEDEEPKEWHKRLHEEAVARPAPEAPIRAESVPEPEDESPPDPKIEAVNDLTDHQWSVLQFFNGRAKVGETVTASFKDIASEGGVAQGSMPYFMETLEKKGFIEIVERGSSTKAGTYRLLDPTTRTYSGPTCVTCGGPRSAQSVSQCNNCYRGGLRGVSAEDLKDLPPEVVAQLSKPAQELATKDA